MFAQAPDEGSRQVCETFEAFYLVSPASSHDRSIGRGRPGDGGLATLLIAQLMAANEAARNVLESLAAAS
jgi:hypothetical protein